jgi:hypothetical protein
MKLTSEQRAALWEWLAADYDSRLIRLWFEKRGWPRISDQLLAYYRKSREIGVARIRQQRRSQALSTGLALREERVKRLAAHADELEAIMWVTDDKGKLHNEKAWRETLDQIAVELKDYEESTWQDYLRSRGYDPARIFESMVNAAAGVIRDAPASTQSNAGGSNGSGDRKPDGEE